MKTRQFCLNIRSVVLERRTGLPPAGFQQGDLPEPESRGAGLVQAYCKQCHGLSSPKMHTSAEWPLLVRRMLMRAEVLKYRLDGATTEAMVDEMLLAGLRSSQLPSAEDTDSLIAYFVRNGLPPAGPDEIPDTVTDSGPRRRRAARSASAGSATTPRAASASICHLSTKHGGLHRAAGSPILSNHAVARNWIPTSPTIPTSARRDSRPQNIAAAAGHRRTFTLNRKTPVLPEKAIPAVREAAAKAGLDFDKYTRIDNTR